MTHPTLYPARQRREWTSDPATGHPVAHLRVDLGSAENEARAALAAFYNALTYTTSYFGWPTTVVDALTTTIEDSMRSEEHTSELQSLMRISYAVFCLKKKTQTKQ